MVTETLYRVEVEGEGVNVRGRVVGVDPVGDFRMYRWCKAHADWVGQMVPFDGRYCRWALKVDGAKPCTLVDRWMESL